MQTIDFNKKLKLYRILFTFMNERSLDLINKASRPSLYL